MGSIDEYSAGTHFRFSHPTGKIAMILPMNLDRISSDFKPIGLVPNMYQQFRRIDLTGAKLEFSERSLCIANGSLGLIDPTSRLVKGHLSVISQVKPNLLSSQVRIGWQDLEFEVMMISLQGNSFEDELKIKFIARPISSVATQIPFA